MADDSEGHRHVSAWASEWGTTTEYVRRKDVVVSSKNRQRIRCYLDVDGVISPFGQRGSADFSDWQCTTTLTWSLEMAAKLKALDFKYVWLTTWQHEANEYVSSTLGLGQMEVIERRSFEATGWWKWEELLAQHPVGEPFVWIDDEILRGEGDELDWTQRGQGLRLDETLSVLEAKYLLISPDGNVGLTREHLAEMAEFLAAVR